MLAYSIGRLGCHLAGDGCWGIPNSQTPPKYWLLPESFWASTFSHNVIKQGVPILGAIDDYPYHLNTPVFPTSLYESIAALFLSILLFKLQRKTSSQNGLLFAICILLMCSERFLIEFIRVNPKISILGLEWSQAQYISFVLILISSYKILKSLSQSCRRQRQR
jgi:phosphatidylglycerol---prolipoprotein diacylglyceryl transferase